MACHLAEKQTRRPGGGMRKCRSMYRKRGSLSRSGTLRGLKYREMQRKVNVQVEKAKQRAYDNLYVTCMLGWTAWRERLTYTDC